MEKNIISGSSRILKRAKLRRQQEYKIRFLRFVSALITVMTVATCSLSIRSFASEKDSGKPSYKYYTSYTVNEGESLSMLARKFMTDEYRSEDRYIAEVVSINHILSASDIYEGQVIILPYYSTDIK